MATMPAILKIYLAISPASKSQFTPNFVGDIGVSCRSKIAKIMQSDIQDGRHGSHLENLFFASSPELKGQLTRNLVGSIGVTCRSKIAKIVPIVNPSWLPFRVCSNDHAQLTGMPYIFFFKIKNCLNDDLFISCDDRIGKCCITSAYLQWLCHSGERPVACGPLVTIYFRSV